MTDPIDPLEQGLALLLEERAEAVEAGVPPIAQLLAEGRTAARHQRRARTWGAAGAAAAVAVVASIPALVIHDDRTAPRPAQSVSPTPLAVPTAAPTSVADLPQAPSGPDWVYTRGDRIVIGTAGDAPWGGNSILSASGHGDAPPVALWTEPGSDVVHTWRDGKDVPFGTGPDALTAQVFNLGGVLISPDGSTVYSSYPLDKDTVTVTAYDAGSGDVIGTRQQPKDPGGDIAWPMLGADSDGRLYLASDARDLTRRWDPRTDQIVTVTGMPDQLGFIAPNAVGVMPGGHEEYGTVGDSGVWHHLIDVPFGTLLWSPDGSTYLAAPHKTQAGLTPAKVVETASLHATRLLLPTASFDRGVAFEQDSAGTPVSVLVLTQEHKTSTLVRCALDTGACERVLDLPTGDILATGPETY